MGTALEIGVIDTRCSSIWSYDHSYHPCHQDLTKRIDYSVLGGFVAPPREGSFPRIGTNTRCA